MKNKLPENNSIRLASLDILRGFVGKAAAYSVARHPTLSV